MGRARGGTTIALSSVGAISIAFGGLAAVCGVPDHYGMTTAQALDVAGDKPLEWTFVWVAWAVLITLLAIWRARWIAHHEPQVRLTAVRGAIWLSGAIGATWVYPWVAWDIPLYEYFDEHPPQGTESVAVAIGVYWWLGALLALLVGAAWSSAIGIAQWRKTPANRTSHDPSPHGAPVRGKAADTQS